MLQSKLTRHYVLLYRVVVAAEHLSREQAAVVLPGIYLHTDRLLFAGI